MPLGNLKKGLNERPPWPEVEKLTKHAGAPPFRFRCWLTTDPGMVARAWRDSSLQNLIVELMQSLGILSPMTGVIQSILRHGICRHQLQYLRIEAAAAAHPPLQGDQRHRAFLLLV